MTVSESVPKAVYRLALAGALGVILLAGCGSAPAATDAAAVAQGCRAGTGVMAHTTTKTYIVQVDIGPMQNMYTQAEADAQHPRAGQLMLQGQMSAVGGPAAAPGGSAAAPGGTPVPSVAGYLLEAHICSKAGGAVIQAANPTITVVNDATKQASGVQVAVMEGLTAGLTDLHYGNNVLLAAGGAYTVLVALNGETATLHIQVPAGGITGSNVVGPSMGDMPGIP